MVIGMLVNFSEMTLECFKVLIHLTTDKIGGWDLDFFAMTIGRGYSYIRC